MTDLENKDLFELEEIQRDMCQEKQENNDVLKEDNSNIIEYVSALETRLQDMLQYSEKAIYKKL